MRFRFLVAGKGPSGGSPFGFAVDRITATGQADTTFGVNGQSLAYFSGTNDAHPVAMTIGPDGKITVTGFVEYDQGGVYVPRIGTARFLNDITSNTSLLAATTAVTTAAITGAAPLVAPSFGSLGSDPVASALDSPDLWVGLGLKKHLTAP